MSFDEILFTVGPLEMHDEILKIGAEKIPYFRTSEFSNLNIQSANLIKKFLFTSEKSEVIFLTCSGTGAMEASLINLFESDDKILIINGGTFGKRFVEISNILNLNYTEIKLDSGVNLTNEKLEEFRGKGYTGLIINAHETSTGILYDLEMIGEFCKKEGLMFVVDSISSFLADDYYMDKWNIDVTIISSQKALALPPGLSIIALNQKAKECINNNCIKSLYFDLKLYMRDMKRGQTPFTPAVGIMRQLNARLLMINQKGIKAEIKNINKIAKDFRSKISDIPVNIKCERLSNTLTPVYVNEGLDANVIYNRLKNEYGLVVNPTGGVLEKSMFRVGHIGNLDTKYNDKLIEAIKKIILDELKS